MKESFIQSVLWLLGFIGLMIFKAPIELSCTALVVSQLWLIADYIVEKLKNKIINSE